MPELPEVETVCRGMARLLPDQRLRKTALRREDLRWPIPADAVQDLSGRKCTRVARRSKYLQLHFNGHGRPVALIHLGMSGRLSVDEVEPGQVPPDWRQHEHWRMDFGRYLVRYADARRFGMLDVVQSDELSHHWLIRDLGPEPLGSEFTAEFLFRLSRKRRTPLKSLLMDARNVVGVGNIYASEACFRAGVRPRRRASRLTKKNCTDIVHALREVLGEAIDQGGTTIRDYIGIDEGMGYFQQSLHVYGRHGEPCHGCQTPIKRVVDSGRSTYYCPSCQV